MRREKEKRRMTVKSYEVGSAAKFTKEYRGTRVNTYYNILEEGRDWVKIRAKGRIRYVPTLFIDQSEDIEEELETYEDIISSDRDKDNTRKSRYRHNAR